MRTKKNDKVVKKSISVTEKTLDLLKKEQLKMVTETQNLDISIDSVINHLLEKKTGTNIT